MRPLIIDTNIWVEWLRGRDEATREQVRGRVVIMPAIVALELISGTRNRRSSRVVFGLVGAFERRRRLLSPVIDDFKLAGETLAELGWPASSKTNDALIVSCARRVGGEVLSRDLSDLGPLARAMTVPLLSPDATLT